MERLRDGDASRPRVVTPEEAELTLQLVPLGVVKGRVRAGGEPVRDGRTEQQQPPVDPEKPDRP